MKPILLGMNNPLSDDPRYALYPEPSGCAGHNLWKISGMDKGSYLDAFERQNLIVGKPWSWKHLDEAARPFLLGEYDHRRLIILGEDVARALGHKAGLFQWEQRPRGGWWVKIPHPSGRCMHWNDPVIRECGMLLLQEAAETT